MGIQIKHLILGPVQTNCYLVMNEETREIIVVDPGDHAPYVERTLDEKNGTVVGILLTHGHFDHILAVDALREYYHVPVYAAREERPVLTDPIRNLSESMGESTTLEADRYLEDGETFEMAHLQIRCILTPGHTEGSCCYYLPEQKKVFSGDTLFWRSVGRTDFPGGSMEELLQSLDKLFELVPDEAEVYPGHDRSTSIGYEKRMNPYVNHQSYI